MNNRSFLTDNNDAPQGSNPIIGELIRRIIKGWYWILLSVVVCLSLAYVHTLSTPTLFMRSITVLIEDGSKGVEGKASNENVNLGSNSTNMNNELFVMGSRSLTLDVVRDLELSLFYRRVDAFGEFDMYNTTPIRVSFPKMDSQPIYSFEVTKLSEKQVSISNFSSSNIATVDTKSVTVNLGDTVLTPVGQLVITPTLYFSTFEKGVPIVVDKQNDESVAIMFNSRLSLEFVDPTTTIVRVAMMDSSPKRAGDFLTKLIEVYNQKVIDNKMAISANTENFIQDRLFIIEQELGGVDSQIANYKRRNQLTDVISESKMYLESSSEFNAEDINIANQLSLATQLRDYMISNNDLSGLIPGSVGVGDNVETLIAECNEMILRREKLLINGSTRNPVVVELSNSIGSLRQTILRTIENMIVGLEIKLKNVETQKANTSRMIRAVPQYQKDIVSIERQQKIKESLYLYLLNKREENALSQSLTEDRVRVIDAVMGAGYQISPNKRRTMTLALIIGLILPMGLISLLVLFDKTIKGKSDVLSKAGIPFLGSVPMYSRSKSEKSTPILVDQSSTTALAESLRVVRTNIVLQTQKNPNEKVLMVTSLNHNSGKTFIASHVAALLAQSSKRVVVVDMDLRAGTLSQRMGATGHGVVDYLSDESMSWHDLITQSGINANLDVIGAGAVSHNPTELLMSARFAALIELLKQQYDYVVLDTTISNMVVDTTIIGQFADMTIYVVRANVFEKKYLAEIENIYNDGKFKGMSLLLNGVEFNTYNKETYGNYSKRTKLHSRRTY